MKFNILSSYYVKNLFQKVIFTCFSNMGALRHDIVSCYFDLPIITGMWVRAAVRGGGGVFKGTGVKDPVC